MEATHLSAWLGDAETIPILDDASITVVREHVRQLGAELALALEAIEIVATAATELARNQLVHAVGSSWSGRSNGAASAVSSWSPPTAARGLLIPHVPSTA